MWQGSPTRVSLEHHKQRIGFVQPFSWMLQYRTKDKLQLCLPHHGQLLEWYTSVEFSPIAETSLTLSKAFLPCHRWFGRTKHFKFGDDICRGTSLYKNGKVPERNHLWNSAQSKHWIDIDGWNAVTGYLSGFHMHIFFIPSDLPYISTNWIVYYPTVINMHKQTHSSTLSHIITIQ